MDIIKEYCYDARRVILRSSTYSRSMEYFNELYAEAKKDFPFLTPDMVEVTHYAGRRYKGTFGIEFQVSSLNTISDKYFMVDTVELVLG